jgi:aryl-alcohol dehydrogenase-like predicted oxidoreductase
VLPKIPYGSTGLEVTRIGLGGFPLGAVNRARGWDPYTAEGRAQAIRVVHAALDAGINVVDTAPAYGNGHSESIIGEALTGRRTHVVLATKVRYTGSAADVTSSVEESLRRLRTDAVDVIQFHGGMYTQAEVERIVDGGLLEALERLREQGKARFVGLTVEEPWTARPLVATGRFACVQVRYNLIFQAAALHLLDDTRAAGLGVSVMRPMTSGMLQRVASYVAPRWTEDEMYEAALKFVLSDSRVHVANIGMRFPREVERNVRLAIEFKPPFDMAGLPRLTAGIYSTEDEAAAGRPSVTP